MTPADCYRAFYADPRMTWEELFAMLDAVAPLTCLRDSSGDFVRDGDGRIVVVAAVTEQEQAA